MVDKPKGALCGNFFAVYEKGVVVGEGAWSVKTGAHDDKAAGYGAAVYAVTLRGTHKHYGLRHKSVLRGPSRSLEL